jgi:hypothetical protein
MARGDLDCVDPLFVQRAGLPRLARTRAHVR